ncbi:MAG: tail fiber domain-containing protein [Bacteroidota bacterium]
MKQYLLLMIVTLSLLKGFSQNIGINATGATPHASALLDVSSTNKGFLMPRMSSAQRTAIATPAEGLKVYDTDTKSFWFFNGTGWIEIAAGSATNYWALNGTHIFNSNGGNVGIGVNTPAAPLHIKNDNEALRIQGATPYLSFANNAGQVKGFLQSYNNDLYLGTPSTNTTGNLQFYAANIPAMTIKPTADVIIGSDPSNTFGKFSVQTLNNSNGISHLGEGGNILATRMGGTSAGIGTFSNTNMRIFSNGNSAVFINAGNSYVGVGVDFPTNKLQVGSIGNTGYSGNDFAFGDGTNALRMYQTSTASLVASSADILFWPKEKAGHVGINCVFPPSNKLQVGDMGPAGYNGNDIAFGNGTQGTAITQTNTSSQFASTTDFAFLPKYGTGGRVGINTGTPRAPLDVSYALNINSVNSNSGYGYLSFNNANNVTGFSTDDNPVQNVSIIASGRIYAREFDAYSDARIKNITGVSNAGKDLETLNELHITNYTLKDNVMYGNRSFKKVIAQQVEKVYPQVVSKHIDFIPNVYQLANTVTKTNDGFLLTFKQDHHINTNAKHLQVTIEGDGGMQPFDIVSIPSATEVIIKADALKGNKVFVYGEEVDDFRTVDYEGLTTLNISATQELARLVKLQSATIEGMQRQISLLQKRVAVNDLKKSGNKLYLKQASAQVVLAR